MKKRWVAICILITGLVSLTRPHCVPPSPLILRSCPPPSNAFTGFFRIVRRTKIFFSPAGFAVERTRILPVFVSPPPVWNQILPAGSKTAHSEEEINECSHCQQPANEEHNNRQTCTIVFVGNKYFFVHKTDSECFSMSRR